MNRQKRILLISPVAPDPDGIGVEKRAYQWAAQLAAEGELHLVAVPDGRAVPASVRRLTASCRIVKRAATGGRSRHWVVPADIPSLPPTEGYSRTVVFRLYTHGVAAALAGELNGARLEMDLDDVESDTHRSQIGIALRRGWLRKAMTCLRDAQDYAALERELLPSYARVHVAAQEDAEILRARFPGLHAVMQPNRIRVPADAVRCPADRPTFLFVGALAYVPNCDAVVWMAESLVPALRTRLGSDFRLLIAGRGLSSGLQSRLVRIPEIDCLGEIAELGPLYAKAHAALAPMRCGGGTKIKVLEAFARRCPVVATPHATRGLGVKDGVHVLQAVDAPAFAAACAALIASPNRSGAIADAALELTRENFSLNESAAVDSANEQTERGQKKVAAFFEP